MPTAEVVLPWRISSDLAIEIESVVHASTGIAPEGLRLDLQPAFGDPSVDLCDVNSWSHLRVGLRVHAPVAEMNNIVAANEDPTTDLKCVCVLVCSATKTRRAVELSAVKVGEWVGEVELARHELAATGSLRARLVRAKKAAHDDKSKAGFKGALVGETNGVQLFFDTWARPYNGPIKWKWTRFDEYPDPWLRTREADLVFVDASDTPTVFMNLGVPEFQVVLESKERVGAAALLRDATAVGIATLAWQQLILTAICHQRKDEETGEYDVTSDWRGAVARSALAVMYPEKTPTDALSAFRIAIDEEDQRPLAYARVTAAAQHLAHTGREFSRSAKLAEKVGNKQ
jgi:hypothetical protein